MKQVFLFMSQCKLVSSTFVVTSAFLASTLRSAGTIIAVRDCTASEFLGGAVCCAEFVYGKGDRAEETARIFIVGLWNAFFVRYAVIRCVDKDLCRSFKSYNRENSDRDIQTVASIPVQKQFAVRSLTELLRDFHAVRASARILFANDLRVENNRLNSFNLCNRRRVLYRLQIANAAVGIFFA